MSLCNCLHLKCLCSFSTKPLPCRSSFPAIQTHSDTHILPCTPALSEHTSYSAFAQPYLPVPQSIVHSFLSCPNTQEAVSCFYHSYLKASIRAKSMKVPRGDCKVGEERSQWERVSFFPVLYLF